MQFVSVQQKIFQRRHVYLNVIQPRLDGVMSKRDGREVVYEIVPKLKQEFALVLGLVWGLGLGLGVV
jgi:hypothetical protein